MFLQEGGGRGKDLLRLLDPSTLEQELTEFTAVDPGGLVILSHVRCRGSYLNEESEAFSVSRFRLDGPAQLLQDLAVVSEYPAEICTPEENLRMVGRHLVHEGGG